MAKIRTSGYATRRSSFVTAFIGDCDYEAMPAIGNPQISGRTTPRAALNKHASRWGSINPKVEIRDPRIAAWPPRGFTPKEARNPKDKPAPEQFCISGFGFWISFGLRASGFGLCPRKVTEKLSTAMTTPCGRAQSPPPVNLGLGTSSVEL